MLPLGSHIADFYVAGRFGSTAMRASRVVHLNFQVSKMGLLDAEDM
jgi:hypothetical protein